MLQLPPAAEYAGFAYASRQSGLEIATRKHEDDFPGKVAASTGFAAYELQSEWP
jgi:hypothetical protein